MGGEAGRGAARGVDIRTVGGLCQPRSGECRLTTFAGTPAITEWSGNSPRTTAPAATTDCRPIRVPGRMIAPAPTHEPEPIETGLFRGHWRPIGCSGSSYTWFWSVMYTYGPVYTSSPMSIDWCPTMWLPP